MNIANRKKGTSRKHMYQGPLHFTEDERSIFLGFAQYVPDLILTFDITCQCGRQIYEFTFQIRNFLSRIEGSVFLTCRNHNQILQKEHQCFVSSDSFFSEIGTPCFWAIVSPLYNKITLTKRNKKLSRDVIQCVHVLCRQNNNKQFQLFFCLPFPSASLKKALNHHDGS